MDQLKLDFKNWENIKKESNIKAQKLDEMIEKFRNDLRTWRLRDIYIKKLI